VSLHRVDARFLLPAAPRTAVVLGPLDGWREGLLTAGVELDNRRDTAPELAVATADRVDEALALGAPMVIVEAGRGVRPLRNAGLSVSRYLPRPTVERPQVVIPVDQPPAARYATAHWAAAGSSWRRARNRLADAVFASKVFPSLGTITAIGARDAQPPAVVRAAEEHGAVARSWLLTPGPGDDLSRNVFHLFPPGARAPAWVLKFARVPGYRDPFDRDEAGLTLARNAGAAVAGHAPSLLSRFTVDGLEAALETAATGERLTRLLGREPRGRAHRSLQEVAEWIVAMGEATRGDPAALAGERARLRDEVVPRWRGEGADERLVNGLPELPAVLQHNDVGPWNIVVDDRSFTVVDWESARRYGLPLWDLVYFLTEALAGVDRVLDQDRDDYTVKLFRGALPSSATLFEWIRRGVRAAEIPPDAVGRIVTLCWLHHGLSHTRRGDTLRRTTGSGQPLLPAAERIAAIWLADPELGPDWSRWRA
jgi:Phosphotransferase enzyme family